MECHKSLNESSRVLNNFIFVKGREDTNIDKDNAHLRGALLTEWITAK